jgi:hypothetical protein
LGRGHACAEACGWKDDEYLHNPWSIHRLAASIWIRAVNIGK